MHLTRSAGDVPAPWFDREWLLTDGAGGFAMGTACGAPSRRYHGFLCAALDPPVRRVMAIHSIVETFECGNETSFFTAYRVGDDFRLHPEGWKGLTRFDLDLVRGRVAWHYETPLAIVTRELRVDADAPGEAIVRYQLQARQDGIFRLRPLLPLRSIHDVRSNVVRATPGGDHATVEAECSEGRIHVDLAVRASGPIEWRADAQTWQDLTYSIEQHRGQEWHEDAPAPIVADLEVGVQTIASVELRATLRAERPATPRIAPTIVSSAKPVDRLHAAANQFIVQRGGTTSVIAGYPWFVDWGRDAMISLPGLLIATGRAPEAIKVIESFVRHLRDGLIPNCFDDHGADPRDNAVDAPLWLVRAVAQCSQALAAAPPPHILDACRAIIDSFSRGTRHGVREEADGLLAAGEGTEPVTWMDAFREGQAFTPRDGCAVEISALWHEARRSLAEMTDDPSERRAMREAADETAASLARHFWWSDRACLHDVVDGERRGDHSVRPNQLFAVSLPHGPVSGEQASSVISVVENHLLTPFGLRTLEPSDPRYIGRFEGDLMALDAAYHNGTVWPWLIGPYGDALLRVHGRDATPRVREAIAPLIEELDRGCLGQIAEVYDGDAPHRPSGCCAQAWSVAEVLRLAIAIGD